jgi:membrane protease subunit (stomatin/prohibitin family)
MALFDREYIATPDDRKGQIVYKHPDINIRKFTKAIVNADQTALFVNKGSVVGEMGPGQHSIDADELPFLGVLVDNVIARNMYRAELYFVTSRDFVDEPFGGRIDDVFDPQTKQVVSLRVFGEYAMRVTNPVSVVTKLVGTVDCSDNERITDWVDQMLMKTMKVEVTRQIVRNGWPIMGLSAFIPDIESAVVVATNVELQPYGLALTKMGNFDLNLADEDLARLKKFANDVAYTQLAGSYTDLARAEMMRGAGEGMAQGGAGAGAAMMGVGFGVAPQMAAAPAAAVPPPPVTPFPTMAGGAPTGSSACPSCSAPNPSGAKFCVSCGTGLTPATIACTACQAENPANAKFCSSCGSSLAAAAGHCTNCGMELIVGAKFCPDCGTPTPM